MGLADTLSNLRMELAALPDDRKSLHDLRAALDGAIAGFEGVLAQTAGGPLADPLAAAQLTTRATEIARLDWKLDDVVVAPVAELPEGVRTEPVGLQPDE